MSLLDSVRYWDIPHRIRWRCLNFLMVSGLILQMRLTPSNKIFFLIEFSTCFIRKLAPLVFFVLLVFLQKRPSLFFFINPIKKTLFRMMEFSPKNELCSWVSVVNYLLFPTIKLLWNMHNNTSYTYFFFFFFGVWSNFNKLMTSDQ